MRFLHAVIRLLVLLVGGAALALWLAFGGGDRLEDRTTDPRLPGSALEVVADLPLPPGNIAVSRTGRVFFTFHPEGSPPIRVAELVNRKPVAYPNDEFQKPQKGTTRFQTPLSLRIDRQDRLWVLDYASYGIGQPRLLAFELGSNQVVHQYDFPSSIAGFLSVGGRCGILWNCREPPEPLFAAFLTVPKNFTTSPFYPR